MSELISNLFEAVADNSGIEITIAIPETTVSVGSTTEPQTYQCTANQGTSIEKSGTSCDTDEKSTHLTCDMSRRQLNCCQSDQSDSGSVEAA